MNQNVRKNEKIAEERFLGTEREMSIKMQDEMHALAKQRKARQRKIEKCPTSQK